ncbi:MAG TPA: phage holin family protein [Candidatus Limnocylindrales bacterium]|nr:phage holin family protein [Candidatus Limnocylindrales bacterium]
MGLLWRTLINAVAIAVAALFIPGIEWGVGYADDTSKILSLAGTGLVLGLVNAFVRPILVLVSLPITIVTLGLFLLVINALLLMLVSAIPVLGFQVDGFLPALLGSIVISIVSAILSRVFPR